MSEKGKFPIFNDLAQKFSFFKDEIGDMEIESIIIPDDLPNTIEIYGVHKGKRVYVKIHKNRSTLDYVEVMDNPS